MDTNPYDQFDAAPTVNPFDQFDSVAPTASSGASEGGMSLGDVGLGAVENFVPSAAAAGKAIVQTLSHPIDTANAIGSVVTGGAQELDDKLGLNQPGPPSQDEQHFDALKAYFANRYGNIENLKKAVATDPAGVGMDLSTIFTGGETALAKAPGILGKAGEVSGDVGRAVNPVNVAVKAAKTVTQPLGKGLTDVIGNLGTHTGAAPLEYAFKAGQTGGGAAQAFLDNMRGNVPLEDVVSSAKDALSQMRIDKSAAYRSGMVDISNERAVLSFDPIDKAMAKSNTVKNFKGQDLSPATADVRDEVGSIIDQWKILDPAEFHTPEGFDALKQRIGDVRDSLPYNTPQRLVADNAYSAVRNAVAAQVPQYSQVMKEYQSASDAVDQIQKSLSLGKKTGVDTSLRKLQSVMRNNVNTNYGYRSKMLDTLSDAGAPNLPYELSGQSLNKLTPRGLGAAEAGALAMGAVATGNGPLLAALPLMSPRLMGEAYYGAGKLSRATDALDAISRGATDLVPGAYEASALVQGQQPTLQYADGGRVHAAANEAEREPSDAKIEAGNYRKGHVRLHGFDISVETPRGAARRGVGGDGKPWENRHETAHYGYIKRTQGADGEHVDAYIGPHPDSKRIFVVNQFDPKTRKFDEHKVVFGARGQKEARAIYDGGFSDRSGPKRRWAVHEVTRRDLAGWLDGYRSQSKPYAPVS